MSDATLYKFMSGYHGTDNMRAKAQKMLGGEFANTSMSPRSSASAPSRTPMREYKRGGHVEHFEASRERHHEHQGMPKKRHPHGHRERYPSEHEIQGGHLTNLYIPHEMQMERDGREYRVPHSGSHRRRHTHGGEALAHGISVPNAAVGGRMSKGGYAYPESDRGSSSYGRNREDYPSDERESAAKRGGSLHSHHPHHRHYSEGGFDKEHGRAYDLGGHLKKGGHSGHRRGRCYADGGMVEEDPFSNMTLGMPEENLPQEPMHQEQTQQGFPVEEHQGMGLPNPFANMGAGQIRAKMGLEHPEMGTPMRRGGRAHHHHDGHHSTRTRNESGMSAALNFETFPHGERGYGDKRSHGEHEARRGRYAMGGVGKMRHGQMNPTGKQLGKRGTRTLSETY